MATTTKNRSPFFAILLMSLFIAAIGVGCGGGGGSAPTPPPEPAIDDAQGLFTTNGDGSGTFTVSGVDVAETLADIKGMVYGDLPNQKFIFFDIATNILYKGTITAVTPNIVGTATVYNDGVMVENNVVVSGTVVPESSIDLSFAGSGDFVSGTIKGSFSTAYNNAATKDRISNNVVLSWVSAVPGSIKMVLTRMKTSDFVVDSFNVVTNVGSYIYISSGDSSDPQCGHAGSLTAGAPKNIYPLTGETITDTKNCTISTSPDYTGFASVVAVDGAGKGTEMWYATTNGTNSIFMILTK